MWAAGGITIGFVGFLLLSKIQNSVWVSLLFGLPPGFVVLPFMFYRPKKGTLSFSEYIRYKRRIKRRNNTLPNKRTFDHKNIMDDVEIISPTVNKPSRDVRHVDIKLGGGD